MRNDLICPIIRLQCVDLLEIVFVHTIVAILEMQYPLLARVTKLKIDALEVIENALGGLAAQNERFEYLYGQVSTFYLHSDKVANVVQFAFGYFETLQMNIEPPLREWILPTAETCQFEIIEHRGDAYVDDLAFADVQRLPKTCRK